MNVSLTSDLEDLIHQKVCSGRYRTASEVVREALRLFEEREAARPYGGARQPAGEPVPVPHNP